MGIKPFFVLVNVLYINLVFQKLGSGYQDEVFFFFFWHISFFTNYHDFGLFFKVGSTRKLIATAYGQRGGKENLHILKKMVIV